MNSASRTTSPAALPCAVCGGREFRAQRVLGEELVAAWDLAPDEEVAHLDVQ